MAVLSSSAYEFTRTIVPETDDPYSPSLTIRMVFLGTAWAVALGLVNGIFSFRTNAFFVSGNVVALLSYPMGLFMARVLPRGILNPGPFTIKEHVLVYVIASAAGGAPYGIENVIGQYFDKFLGDKQVTFWNSLMFILTTQMIGYGISGMTRRFLVRSAAMYWPGVLPTVALFVSFHEQHESEEEKKVGGPTRYSFFWTVFVVIFIFQWLPSYYSASLQAISILCFSSNRVARWLGAASPDTGVGVLSLSFDWTNFGATYAPLATPFWASVNFFVGNVVVLWVLAPIGFSKHWFGTPNLEGAFKFDDGTDFPRINSVSLFNRTGNMINPTTLYNPGVYDLNLTAYAQNAPIYMAMGFVMTYATSFATLTAGLTHVALW
eukprot:jgi/Hompol1/2562/HPOL_006050-RA